MVRTSRLPVALGAGAAMLAAAALVVRCRATAAPMTGPRVVEIAPGVGWLGLGGRSRTNVYLLHGAGGRVLVDAGWAADGPRIRAAVDAAIGPAAAPAAIVLTHVHPDHAGAARDLAADWGCPILVHPAEIPVADGDWTAIQAIAGPMDRWVVLPLMRALGRRRREEILARGRLGERVAPLPADGSVPGLEDWTWVATPGHTPGHVSLVRRSDGVAITGDALLTLRVNDVAGLLLGRGGLAGPPWYTTTEAWHAAASIRALAALSPGVVAPGHGRPMTGPGTSAAVARFAERR